MAISWNEIRDRAMRFSAEWANETRERAEKDSFWNDFFQVFGISRRRVASFEKPVKKLGNRKGYVDLFWEGTLLVEHKSRGEDLEAAFTQATDYFSGLKDYELPQYVLVSDFARFRLYDLDTGDIHELGLEELHKEVKLFGFIAGYQKTTLKPEDPVNVKAAELMGRLHDQLELAGYTDHSLEVFLVRLLFCLFADDTSIFEKNAFKDYLEQRTNEDGSDLGMTLTLLFQVLNTPPENRMKSLDEQMADFPYINGNLFAEILPIAAFDSRMRSTLLQASALDWGKISPAIFGSMFQSVMNPEERRNLGAHYTSETNILKLIKPLFLDELWAEFHRVKKNRKQLTAFHHKLGRLSFLDPACGCGNFLVITYRELRLLELEVLRILHRNQQVIGIGEVVWVDVDQFFGIEYDEWPARIAEVALWLMDHQMNMKISEEFGEYFVRLPLKKSATIVHGNALRRSWEEVIPKNELNYILGNPPFVGAKNLNSTQKEDMKQVLQGVESAGLLDYVCAWYVMAAKYIQGTNIRVAFVSTDSIVQGEQVGVLWQALLEGIGVEIFFAHRSFQWSNEARGKAAVYCVIIGFSAQSIRPKRLFSYFEAKGEPHESAVSGINGYLTEGANIYLSNRSRPICDVPLMGIGNKPIDGGHYLFDEEGLSKFIEHEPEAKPLFRRWMGATEFLYGSKRWVLWLGDVDPARIRRMPRVVERINAVRNFRLGSKSAQTRKLADTPTKFHVENIPDGSYLVIPEVTSERRNYLPIGFNEAEIMASNLVKISGEARLYHFGVLSSKMHLTWMKRVCGRLEGRYRYSTGIVYNNYPWPKEPNAKRVQDIEACAARVIDTREKFEGNSLADLYDPLTMPPELLKAHQALDRVVDSAYRSRAFTNDEDRFQFLIELYLEYIGAR